MKIIAAAAMAACFIIGAAQAQDFDKDAAATTAYKFDETNQPEKKPL